MLGIFRRKLVPVLGSDFWTIGDNPDLGKLQGQASGPRPQECVDHHVFKTTDGKWHLWGCIRNTAVGRVLYHWESESVTSSHWSQTGEVIRADQVAGESIEDWNGEEWIQSPFIVKDGETYFMFYGGHGTGVDRHGIHDNSRTMECQICVMRSDDGLSWSRVLNEFGQSRIFVGPGETRDPCVVKICGIWHMYYAGYEYINGKEIPAYYVRKSSNLVNWSEYQTIHVDRDAQYGSGQWNTECPYVTEKDGYYYLFRTENYAKARTHVFRSEDPYDFGIGFAGDKYLGIIGVAAPEIVWDNGREYITSNHDLTTGTKMCELLWVET